MLFGMSVEERWAVVSKLGLFGFNQMCSASNII